MDTVCHFEVLENAFGSYAIDVTSTNIITPEHTLKFMGFHSKGKGNSDVREVNFKDCILEFFPRELFEHFPKIKNLSIVNCPLKEISPSDLKGLEGLRSITIENSFLRIIPKDLFTEMKSLRHVSFKSNKIEYVHTESLIPLHNQFIYFGITNNLNFNEWSLGSISFKVMMNNVKKFLGKSVEAKEEETQLLLASKIGNLWSTRRFADFEVVVDSKRFKVHKSILGVQSEKFAKLFEENEDATEIMIKDFSESSVELLLRYLYTSKIVVEGTDNILELFKIASTFGVDEMKEKFKKILQMKLHTFNETEALEIFLVAHQHECDSLKEEAFKAIGRFLTKKLPQLHENLSNEPELLKKLIEKRIELEMMMKNSETF